MEKTTQFYVVKTGDNLTKIARRFHTTVDQLMAWNPQIKDRNKIYPDQRIRVAPPQESETDGEHSPFQGQTSSKRQ
ncbi:LysM peptidoglycan-binding domain-containing protein [Streptomyces violarus]|uniref:LysM peptidoglycan-binding domain-containing protein n=1 Tax=Streptomyces violarus TaxID=67380 RepID=UPI0021C0ECB1|nr:LysM domain-containing protein [Streptomyces violarus]MCT9138809.1 LysM peptidoglycan-binding domain-containing protein [Streptomyces violarus]